MGNLIWEYPAGAKKLGLTVGTDHFFDTVKVKVASAAATAKTAVQHGANLRVLDDSHVTIAFDETSTLADVDLLLAVLNGGTAPGFSAESLAAGVPGGVGRYARTTPYLRQPIFNVYHSEHEMLRYLKRLENRDLSLAHSMIPLGSCTMKLNATSEMIPITWPELANLHPFVPLDQAEGYQLMLNVGPNL